MISIILFILCSFLPLQNQEAVTYIHINNDWSPFVGPLKVTITGDKFLFTIKESNHFRFFITDTLAVCSISQVSDEFYLISSEKPETVVQNNMIVSQQLDNTINEGKRISFDIPVKHMSLKFHVSLGNDYFAESIDFDYNHRPCSIIIPDTTERIYFGFDTDFSNVMEHPHGYTFQGILSVKPSISCIINPNMNDITISIPNLDDAFFQRYYVQQEYIRICHDTLSWRGVDFIREHK